MKDLYKVLGLPENADAGTIKSTYRKLAKELHPDVTKNDRRKTERFKEVNEAYAVLGDAQKRREYDRLRHAPVRPDGMPEGFDFEEFKRTFGRGGAVRGGGMRGGGVQMGGDFGDLNDVFASLFGGARSGDGRGSSPWGHPRAARGPDMSGILEVGFAESVLGGRRQIRTGSGETVEVQIPPGVESGGRLRVPGRGGPPPGRKGQAGDLYLEVAVSPHTHLRREGNDVELDLPVTMTEALLGAKVQVPTVEGPVTLTVPPGTSSGARLRLRGRGVKRPDGSRGDQHCRVEVVVPRIAPDDAESRRLVEELARRTKSPSVRGW
jgi:DnaJ-class molecular chaperone